MKLVCLPFITALLAVACSSTKPTPTTAETQTPDQTPAKPVVKVEFRIATVKPTPNTVAIAVSGKGDDAGRTVYASPIPVLTEKSISEAYVSQDQFGQHLISIRFNPKGAAIMKEATGNNIGKFMAIIIDGKLVSAPTIQSTVGASVQITGKFTKEEATRIANGLNPTK